MSIFNASMVSLYDDQAVIAYKNYIQLERKYLKTYAFLSERLKNPDYNISHLKMPTFSEHVHFIDSKPYKGWWLIFANFLYRTVVGSVYITYDNEIGIYIHEKFRQSGVGSEILKEIESIYPGETLLANINTLNSPSIKFFEKHGYKVRTTVPGEKDKYNSYFIYEKQIPPLEKDEA